MKALLPEFGHIFPPPPLITSPHYPTPSLPSPLPATLIPTPSLTILGLDSN